MSQEKLNELKIVNSSPKQPPLVVHIIYRLGIGGLENGLVNLINNMPAERFRHAIVSLKEGTDFKQRLEAKGVALFSLNKTEGQDWRSFVRLYFLLRSLQADIVHTRNLATIEYQVMAFFAGIKHRVHGEHGWDVFDPNGSSIKYQLLRRLIKPLIKHFIPLSRQLENYLTEKIHVPAQKITRICNGVDSAVFFPARGDRTPIHGCPFTFVGDEVYIGTVGRMHGVKDQINLVEAFIQIIAENPKLSSRLRLILVGDGPLKAKAEQRLAAKSLSHCAWLPGARNDIADIMRGLDVFVLPSINEGISNTILEAMASGLPVIATDVGGNPELVRNDYNGYLVPKSDSAAIAERIVAYADNVEMMRLHGRNSRLWVLQEFSLSAMVNRYQTVYETQLNNC